MKYTFIGKNIQGFTAAYKPNQKTVITTEIEVDPFDNGRLFRYTESNIETSEISD